MNLKIINPGLLSICNFLFSAILKKILTTITADYCKELERLKYMQIFKN